MLPKIAKFPSGHSDKEPAPREITLAGKEKSETHEKQNALTHTGFKDDDSPNVTHESLSHQAKHDIVLQHRREYESHTPDSLVSQSMTIFERTGDRLPVFWTL